MKSRPLALSLIVMALVTGCDGPGLETRTFRLDHLDRTEAMELIEPYVFSERPGWPGTASTVRGALTVRETDDNLERIARVLNEYDVPQADIRLRFQLIEANGGESTDEAVADVVSELRELFRFQGYRLVGETVVTTTVQGDFRQRLTGTTELWEVSGSVYRPAAEGIRLHDVSLQGIRGQVLQTSATVSVGRTLILGSGTRINADGSGQEGAVILVVRVEAAG